MTDVAIPKDTTAALAVQEEWAQMASAFDDGTTTFVEKFGLTMPRLRTDFGKNGTGFIDDLTGEAVRELRVVFVATPPSRAFWLKSLDEGGGGGPPDCASRVNFKAGRPDDNVANRQSEECAACPHSHWGDDGERPRCAESVNVLAVDPESETFAWLRFAGTALAPFRNYVSALIARRRPVFSVVTHITLEEKSRDALKWLVPRFAIDGELTPAQVAPYREVAEKAMQVWDSVADEMAAAHTDPVDTAATRVGAEFSDQPFDNEDAF